MHYCATLYGKAISATVGALYSLVVWRPQPHEAQAGPARTVSLQLGEEELTDHFSVPHIRTRTHTS